LRSFLRSVLSAGRFAVVLDYRVFRNQAFLSLEEDFLVTKALVKVPLEDIRFFFFHKMDLTRIRKQGRYGFFIPVSFQFRGKERRLEGRVLSEEGTWVLVEIGKVPFLTRSS